MVIIGGSIYVYTIYLHIPMYIEDQHAKTKLNLVMSKNLKQVCL